MSLASLLPPSQGTSLHSGFGGTQAPSLIPPIPEADVDETGSTMTSILTTDNDPDLRATYGELTLTHLIDPIGDG